MDEDLTEEQWTQILRQKLRPEITVKAILKKESFTGTNDQLNSNIKKQTLETHDGFLNVICKTQLNGNFHKNTSKIALPFMKESFWYNAAYPYLSKHNPELAGLAPICYKASCNYSGMPGGFWRRHHCVPCILMCEPNELGSIYLEDVTQRTLRFSTRNKHEIVSLRQAITVFENLAKFHGVWFNWLRTSNDSIGGLTSEQIKKTYSTNIPFWMISSMVKSTAKLVSKLLRLSNADPALITRYEMYIKTKAKHDIKHWLKNSSESPLITMVHGDFWKNNILFSNDDQHVCFVDFQMIAINHPSQDIWYFLSICTDSEWRKANLDLVLKAYYDVYIKYYNGVPDLPELTFGAFQADIEKLRPIALILGAEVVPNVLSPNEIDLTDAGLFVMNELKRKRELEVCGEADEVSPHIAEIRRRLVDLVEEAAEQNII